MAAAVGDESGGGKGKPKKKIPRIDMTPMVDLGFLLLTFFVLVTDPTELSAVKIVIPPKIDETDASEAPPPIQCTKVLNVMMGKDHRIYYFQCPDNEEFMDLNMTKVSKGGLRDVIYEFRKKVNDKWAKAEEPNPMIVVIKPMKVSVYRDLVDVLDEMHITGQTKFIIDKVTPDDEEMITAYEQSMGLN
jgi:biopolymer transport protein ExbD